MTLTVAPGRPEEAKALLESSHALMEDLYPAESNHYLSFEALEAPNIRFLVAREDGRVLGCGAMAIKDGYGEVKSMFTDTNARGKGVADAIMTALSDIAQAANLTHMRLETGPELAAAVRLYERHGFSPCGPFGDYTDDPLSLFFEKTL